MLCLASSSPRQSIARPTPRDLPLFLPYASRQLQAPYRVRVRVHTEEEYVSRADDKSKKVQKAKSAIAPPTEPPAESQERYSSSGSPAPATYTDSDEIVVTAVHDAAGRLVHLQFHRCREIPRLLMQIVALCVPHQPQLTRLTVRWGPLEGEALYEIAEFVPLSRLTDVCLDDSPVPEKNYPALLEHERLRRLSLARCELDDADCAALAAKLEHPRPASRRLYALTLVSNAIGDEGAEALARALRSNRALYHLNLAGNRVTDAGALALLRSLGEFPLTYEELATKRRRLIEFLRVRREAYARCLSELRATVTEAAESGRGARRRTVAVRANRLGAASTSVAVGSGGPSAQDALATRALAMASEEVGAYADPFGLEETVSRDGCAYSLGNGALCFLNLAHNRLGYASVAALRGVLAAQAARPARASLLRVVLDGNALPLACAEYALIQELLERALLYKLNRPTKKVDKSKPKIK